MFRINTTKKERDVVQNYGFAELTVKFNKNSDTDVTAIQAVITTPSLLMISAGNPDPRSRGLSDEWDLSKFYGDPKNLFSNPIKIKSTTNVIPMHQKNCERWENNDPFSSFIVHDKHGKFLGEATLRGNSNKGQAELEVVLDHKKSNKSHQNEAITALTYAWATYLAENDRKINGEELKSITSKVSTRGKSKEIFNKLGYFSDQQIHHTRKDDPYHRYDITIPDAIQKRDELQATFKLKT